MDLIKQLERSRIVELEGKIQQARNDYYNGQATVPDTTFDAWVDELSELQADSPAVTAVGAPATSAWPKVAHTSPMGSLDKVQTPDEMAAWVQKSSREASSIEPRRLVEGRYERLVITEKLDGLSVTLKYVGGRLLQALTRGDGQIGEDITPNVSKMKGVPHSLPRALSVECRGEIILLKDDHQTHFPDTANPRNAASGTSKRLDGVGCEHLTVIMYQAHEAEGEDLRYETEVMLFLEEMGFQTPRWYETYQCPDANGAGDTLKTVVALWRNYQNGLREALPYEIDGLVVRFDDLAHQWSLGEHNGRPKGAVAFKFTPITRETTALRRVDQVGSTGRITPVAEFEPVNILGTTITRASLYNQAYIEQIGFDIGAKIIVSRANDVIPRVESVSELTGTVSQAPTVCPECGAGTERDGEYVVCPNVGGCPAQTEGRIKQWIQKQGIMEWGPTLIEKVVSAGLVKSVPDLYRLTAEQLEGLERMGETSARNAIKELWKILPTPLELFVGSLSIPLCGRSTMRTVVDAGYDTLDKIRAATQAQLEAIPTLGPKRAAALRLWMDQNDRVFDEMLAVGITIKARVQGVLTGKSVCFTGKSNLKRGELEKLVTDAGGVVKKSVGKGLTYLVLADPDSTSSKAQAARKHGTTCLSEESFLVMVQP